MLRQTTDLAIASLRMLLRDRAALIGTFAFPVVFLTVFSLYDLAVPSPGTPVGASGTGGTVSYFDFVFPGILALGIMQIAVMGVAGSIAWYRQLEVLRRLVATPVSPSAFIIGHSAARVVVILGQVIVLLVYGLVLGGRIVGDPLVLLALAIPGNLIFLALGFAIAGRAPTVDAAVNIAGIGALPLMFLSGIYFPLDGLAAPLRTVAAWLPITPLVEGMRAVALDGAGMGDLGRPFALLGLWVIVAFVLARLGFRMSDPPPARRRRSRRRRSRRGAEGEQAAPPTDRAAPSPPR